jgi:hypothetical protein
LADGQVVVAQEPEAVAGAQEETSETTRRGDDSAAEAKP